MINYLTEQVKDKISRSLKIDENNPGFLFHGEYEYSKFLDFELQGLLDLFKADEVIWKRHMT